MRDIKVSQVGTTWQLVNPSKGEIFLQGMEGALSYFITSTLLAPANNEAGLPLEVLAYRTASGHVWVKAVGTGRILSGLFESPGERVFFEGAYATLQQAFLFTSQTTLPELVTALTSVTEGDTTHPVAASVIFEMLTALSQEFQNISTALGDKAPLVGGLVPAINLPSFVDDVLEFADFAAFPVTGESGKIYIAIDTSLDYRWTGSVYSVIGQTPDVIGIGANAFTRYDEAQTLTAPQKVQVKTNIGLSDTDGLTEGAINKYFTESRVLSALLTGLSFLSGVAVTAADSILVAIGKLQKQITDLTGSFRYSINAQTGTTYNVLGTDVNQYGNKILKLTNAAAIAVTLPNPNALTPPAAVGDSFNIRQGGAGGITITGTVSGANTTAAINTTITLIAESSTSWMSVGG